MDKDFTLIQTARPGLCVRPKRESSTRHTESTVTRIGHKDVDKDEW